MLIMPISIAEAARKAGMKVPEDTVGNWDREEYPHFNVFCIAQLGRPMRNHGEHWKNAEVIAAIPDDEIKKIKIKELIERGLSI